MELAFSIFGLAISLALTIWFVVDTYKIFNLMLEIERDMKAECAVKRSKLIEFQLKGFEALFLLGVMICALK